MENSETRAMTSFLGWRREINDVNCEEIILPPQTKIKQNPHDFCLYISQSTVLTSIANSRYMSPSNSAQGSNKQWIYDHAEPWIRHDMLPAAISMQKMVCVSFINTIFNKSFQQLFLTEAVRLPLITLKTSGGTELAYME